MAKILKKRERHERSDGSYWWQPAVIECSCGGEVELTSGFANACYNCGTEYNLGGQRLAPRHQWGDDTGEHFACSCGSCGYDY